MIRTNRVAPKARNAPGWPWMAATIGTDASPIVVARLVFRSAPPTTISNPQTVIGTGSRSSRTPAAAAKPRPAISFR